MLSPKYMKNLPHGLEKYYQGLEDDILRDVIRRVKKAGTLTETGNIQIESLLNLGYDLKEIKKEIVKNVDITANKFGKIVKKAGLDSYQNDVKYYLKGGKKLDNIAQVKNIITGITNNSVSDFKNITGTLGLDGKPLEQFYKDKLNQAFINISSGAFSSDQMIRKTINELGDAGLQVINYKSGRNFSLEAAVKMNLNSTVNRLSAEISLQNARDMNQDLMEITAHEGARPTHQDWQGQIVSLSGDSKYLSVNDIGYGQADGFMGVNCRHNWYPFFEGLSEKYWTKERLKELNPEPFEYEGKIYDLYKANQRVRAIERSIRKSNRKIAMYDEVGDEEGKLNESIKLQRKKQEQSKFNEAMYKNDKKDYNKVTNNNNYKTFKKIEKADEFHRSQTSEYWKIWTNKEKQALYDYTHDSDNFNFPLRFNEPLSEKIKDAISALEKTSLKDDITVVRGVSESGFRALFNIPKDANIKDVELLKNTFIGQDVIDRGFVSTGVNTSGGFKKEIGYEIKCPKGTKGAYLEPFSHYSYAKEGLYWSGSPFGNYLSETGENEFLIQAGTHMKVIDIFKDKGKLKVILEVIL